MKITLSLLKNFLKIKDQPKDIAHTLTQLGIEVDKIENIKPPFTGVISARILETQKCPNSDKLTIAKIFDGKETFQVICGAPNCRKGLIVAFAKIGAVLKDGNNNEFVIKKTKIKDIESFGMLCSGKELQLTEEKDKILELEKDFEIGKDMSYLSSPIFEISLTPNLGHLLGAIGIAKELACMSKQKITIPSLNIKEDPSCNIEKEIKVNLKNESCKRYCSRIIKNVSIKPSPIWLQAELTACGFQPINNVVDAINYTMLKFNQPMHAFDLDKIKNNQLNVAAQEKEEEFDCLDKTLRTIPKGALVIKDAQKTVAIAGIMGGSNSSIDENTKNVVLEAAFFDSSPIRKTSKSLNLKTESSMRFERGIDPNMPPIAIDWAASLIADLANGSIIKGKIDIKKEDFKQKKIILRFQRINKVIGVSISENQVMDILESLDFHILEKNEESILLEVPTYRNDIDQEIDLIEEVARVYGYNNLSGNKPLYRSSSITHSSFYLFEKELKNNLKTCRLQEFKTCDLISPSLAEVALLNSEESSFIKVKHFKSVDQSILRTTLLPSLLEVVKFNHDRKNFDIFGFEISKIHLKIDNKYIEKPTLAIILTGKRKPHLWDNSNFDANFFDLKGILENLLSAYLDKTYKFKDANFKALHPLKQANLFLGEQKFGILGEVHPNILKKFNIKKRVFYSEIDLTKIIKNKKQDIQFTPINHLPSSERDLTISLKEKEKVQVVFDIIEKIKSSFLEKTYLLDLFKTQENKKNVTFRFIYRDKNKTLSNEIIEKEHTKITKEIIKQLEK